jgi:hypothetical protein
LAFGWRLQHLANVAGEPIENIIAEELAKFDAVAQGLPLDDASQGFVGMRLGGCDSHLRGTDACQRGKIAASNIPPIIKNQPNWTHNARNASVLGPMGQIICHYMSENASQNRALISRARAPRDL